MEKEQNELKKVAVYNPDIDQLRGLVGRLDPRFLISVFHELGFAVAKDIAPSRQCGGTVTRTATRIDQLPIAAEDAALKAARDAAQRACQSKTCQDGQTCNYVEKGSEGSSAPLPDANPPLFTATMTTTGSCGCE